MEESRSSGEDVLCKHRIGTNQPVYACGDNNEGRSKLLMNGSLVAELPAPDTQFYRSKEGRRKKEAVYRANRDANERMNILECGH
jgi:hypothetical protein